MVKNIFDTKVKIQEIIDNQLPEFIIDENSNSLEFFKQYYASQEFPGGPVDISDNLNDYTKLDNLIPEVISLNTNLTQNVSEVDDLIFVDSTKGYPKKYGLIKIDDEIITYTGITTNSFIGCIRGFSGIVDFHETNNPDELVFSSSESSSHSQDTVVINLSSLFLKEFYKKIKYTFTPGLENIDFSSNINIGNFIKLSRSFYQSKGTPESFKILFKVLYGEEISIIDLEKYLIKPSSSEFTRRQVIVVESLQGNPINLIGQTITRSDDEKIQASVSEVQVINRKNKLYYELSLFVGYDSQNINSTDFNINPKTKVTESISIGSSVISVDSTVGFSKTGFLLSGNNVISYNGKTINQFLNCENIVEQITPASDLRTDQYVFGYENGDLTKKVELRITGVLYDLNREKILYGVNSGDYFGVRSIGEIISNSSTTKKQILANTWIYNTSSRYQVQSITGSIFNLNSKIDKSSLKIGDEIEILFRGTQTVAHSINNIPFISNINESTNSVEVSNLINFDPNAGSTFFDLRRKLKKATSSLVPIEYGNDSIISDVQNVYNQNDEYLYVASNGLPSYQISKGIVQEEIPYATEEYFDSKDFTTGYYSAIKIVNNPFRTGDDILYQSETTDIGGLVSGQKYYIEVISTDRIRFYESRSFIGSTNFILMQPLTENDGSHKFILGSQSSNQIGIQNILRKFPINQDLTSEVLNSTRELRSLGLFKNGVELLNSASFDKIFYGPLKSVNVLNGGQDYDVINLPLIQVSSPSIGTTALIQPVVSGGIKEVLVDNQEFDVEKVLTVTITGGNGSGCQLQPFISKRFRKVNFDGRLLSNGGGIDIINETITFISDHNFKNGERIIYNSAGNNIGIGIFAGSNLDQDRTLVDGSSYYASLVNNKTIRLYETFDDYFAGINTVGFTTSNLSGIHEFRTVGKNTLSSVKIINSGSGYTNRKLLVKPVGISTIDHTVTFNNHNFADGDLIEYYSTGSAISGISTTDKYYVLKVDSNKFRICNAGTTEDKTNYIRKKFVKFQSTGSGFNVFKYLDITVNIQVSYGTTFVGNIVATPVVKGQIIDAYLYETGVGYGSSLLNLEKKPFISIKNGKNASLRPVIVDGQILRVEVESRGSEYYSTPEILVNGDGTGCKLRAVVQNQKIVDVIVLSNGENYSADKTTIQIISSGSGALIDCNIRDLVIDTKYRFGDEVLLESTNKLQYGYVGYDLTIGENEFGDIGDFHSPIIGWAYDGNPIYGPYGSSDPDDLTSEIKVLKSGYVIDTSNIEDRPSNIQEFPYGFFIDDYIFNNSGDLDAYNGRWCKTPEFPQGTYAYFATIDSTTSESVYPYFIGNYFRSKLVTDNSSLDQNFDFNNSNLIRNTFPYKVNQEYADNDFIIESNEVVNQRILVESVSSGTIEDYEIIEKGDGYRIGDLVRTESTNSGGGFSASVSEISGKQIENIVTNVDTYDDFIFTWKDSSQVSGYISTSHQLFDNDRITISGLSSFVNNLEGFKLCNVENQSASLFAPIPSGTGIVTDIYVSNIPSSLIVDDVIGIGTEKLTVLNIFEKNKILRIKREYVGISHTTTTAITLVKNKITIPTKTNYFESKINDKVYFNSQRSVGIGSTAGAFFIVSSRLGDVFRNISIPTQSIYLPNHPFKTGQEVLLKKPNTATSLLVSKQSTGPSFSLPTGLSETVFVINKSKDFIGIVTNVGLTTNSSGLFFFGSGDDNYEYSIESNFNQIKGKIERISATVSLSTSHTLKDNDIINLKVFPNTTVGIGTSLSIKVTYNNSIDKVLINPIGFNSTGINTISSQITVSNHNLNTGDKVYYKPSSPVPVGLSTGVYYIYKINANKFSLSETLYDLTTNPPNLISIGSTGGIGNLIYKINPYLVVYKNSSLKFDLSDSSLVGYNFKLFYDKNLTKEFVSSETNSQFDTIGFGTVGVTTTASFILNYSNDIPNEIFYSLEKDGNIISSDIDIKNYSKIEFANNSYNGSYPITGIASTTFTFSLRENPIILQYNKNECDVLEYSTTSINENGGVEKIKIISPGYGYKSIPNYSNIESISGKDAFINFSSASIGKINNIKIFNQGYEYSVDKTLSPQAYIPPTLRLENNDRISSIEILDGGRNYTSAPNLIVVNPDTGEIVPYGALEAILTSSSITKVNTISTPYGLSSVQHEIFATNNSNGITIVSTDYYNTGIVTCVLLTPVAGFSIPPFVSGDKIFVEGLQKYSQSGDGFNSSDYGYKFFTVYRYFNTNPAILEFNISGLSTNPGIAVTFPTTVAKVINYSDYPKFNVTQDRSRFIPGEKLLFEENDQFVEKELSVLISESQLIKVDGKFDSIEVGSLIKGKESGVIANIQSVNDNRGFLNIGYYTEKDFGWQSDTGKLNESYQVTTNSDYYQNLSYSIRSSKQFDEISSPVNQLLHPSGLKNFADTQVSSSSSIFRQIGATFDSIVLDLINEDRVDSINNFDLVLDTNVTPNYSNILRLKTKRLTNYINCVSNISLRVDDISRFFSNIDNREKNTAETKDIIEYNDTYANFLVQITNPANGDVQLTDLITISDNNNVFTLEKGNIFTSETELAELISYIDVSDRQLLELRPTDPFNTDLDIKILKSSFSTVESGIGTYSVGFVNLTAGITTCGVGTTSTITKFNTSEVSSVFVSSQIIEKTTGEINFVDLYLTTDGNNAYISEYFIDTQDNNSLSSNYIGTFGSSISSGILSLNYTNYTNKDLLIRSKIVGFGSTLSGIGTYIFLAEDQPEGTESSARYESNFDITTGISTVYKTESGRINSIKSLVKVSIGQTSALHQIMMVQNGINIFTKQYPILSIGSTSGIGTFGGRINGFDLELNFYPDSQFSSTQYKVESVSQGLYLSYDEFNEPIPLEYGFIKESLSLAFFDSINGDRYDKKIFDARHKGIPIFAKSFNPAKVEILDASTGIFTIRNHFFNTGERLIYTPKSTFFGVSASPIGIGATLNSVGLVTTILPTEVYAIRLDSDRFKISTRYDYATTGSGIGITVTSVGSGNAHEFEMYKKLEKTLISLDGVVQSPVTYTLISYNLQNNTGGGIGINTTIISLSGISTIRTEDLLKIDDEYVEISNVGLGTSSSGPIVGIGTYNLVEVIRGLVGTSSTSHTDSTEARIYRGSYNIVGSDIYFTKAPKGSSISDRNEFNLPRPSATFTGRVYLRQDYTKNVVYDDVSDQFTGIGRSMTLTVQGINTTGVQTGSGLVFINNIFQTPSTENNSGNNYNFVEESGKTKVLFTGITSSNGQIIVSDTDINQNQLPRNGIIVSLGSSDGLGYAPLVGAKVRAELTAGSITGIIGIETRGVGNNISTAFYDNQSGYLEVTTTSTHYYPEDSEYVLLEGLEFSCSTEHIGVTTTIFPDGSSPFGSIFPIVDISSSNTFTVNVGPSTIVHNYVGSGTAYPYYYGLNYGSAYRNPVSIAVTETGHTGAAATITATVGVGGSLSFNIINGGSGYTSPDILIPEPSYNNLPVIGVSRLGSGETTETGIGLLVNVNVGPSYGNTGIGSTYFAINSFSISRPGYGFKKGDVFKPVGLVTDPNLASPINEFTITVTDVFTDSFSAIEFGELDYIDTIKSLQNGTRTRFPLIYQGELLTFEADDPTIDLNSILLIFIDGVIQDPGVSYQFTGGSSFTFSEAPKPENNVSIFFYRGTRNIDSVIVDVIETLKVGDTVQAIKNNYIPDSVTQGPRIIVGINTSDQIETDLYFGKGIETQVPKYKPLKWSKQKIDRVINGDNYYKSRNSIETRVYPTAKIIKNVSESDNQIFVDDAQFFNYEENISPLEIIDFDSIIVPQVSIVGSAVTCIISESTTEIKYLSITSGGSGYNSSPLITNIHLRSENFSTGWTNSNPSNATLTANSQLSPVNSLTAGSFSCSTTSSVTRRLYPSSDIITVSGTEYTYSVFLKYSGWRYILISLSSGTTVTTQSGLATFDLLTGTVSSTTNIIGVASISKRNDGWYRISLTTSGNTITTMRPKIILVNSGDTTSSSFSLGVIGSGVLVWGSQLVASTTAGDYIPTTTTSQSGFGLDIAISSPKTVSVGIGTRSTARGTIVGGSLSRAIITNPGFGYTSDIIPKAIVPTPDFSYENIRNIQVVEGFSGIITGISTTVGTGSNPLALKFNLRTKDTPTFGGLEVGYPIYIYDTKIGSGVTSIDSSDSAIVGIGSTFLDNIYYIHSIVKSAANAEIVVNVKSNSSIIGISSFGSITNPLGKFSWGRLANLQRTASLAIGVTGFTVNSGLSSYPTIQRRGFGFQNLGPLRENVPL